MKMIFVMIAALFTRFTNAQHDQSKYPEPEFNNEVYSYRKDSINKLLRLEKGSSKMNTKTKLGGMAGAETNYTIEEEKSPVRFANGTSLSFIFSTGVEQGKKTSPQTDSMMRAQGLDPSMLTMMQDGMMDPSKMIILYKAESEKGERKIYIMKTGGALPFGAKNKSSDKFSFSARKIRDGYWELLIDKTLPKGEYAFSVSGMGMANMDGTVSIFAFAVD